ncbi:LysE/ArgO family amino acid transporter [Couchioplanes caeruleus]|uniref:Amino acid transporter n=2 Tax=Couchioplanes caeruleus TaxID=56438 RepID=A0A1K0GQ60_9ACTN|nr:LysE/ArgO family amino acid transporter [Couchioplanes caeruleus]OJF11403.1 amino acid transporter [Couchioplanes caeruleus subsp. caeruleus]ROP27588.1 L-lysine exporter family protein LysE/ArgO [Couchioplanes caeruleus]
MGSVLAGFGFSLALIVAIGAQNAFVLRQGLRREHVLPVVAVCACADAVLMTAGIAGLGAVLTDAPTVLSAVRWGGAAFLIGYAALAARRAWRPAALSPLDRPPATLRATLLACLAFTFLNPHVYLDTVVLLGTVAHHDPHPWPFGAGAAAASLLWFAALGIGARRLAPLLARPAAWRVVDGAIAVIMTALGVSLAVG